MGWILYCHVIRDKDNWAEVELLDNVAIKGPTGVTLPPGLHFTVTLYGGAWTSEEVHAAEGLEKYALAEAEQVASLREAFEEAISGLKGHTILRGREAWRRRLRIFTPWNDETTILQHAQAQFPD